MAAARPGMATSWGPRKLKCFPAPVSVMSFPCYSDIGADAVAYAIWVTHNGSPYLVTGVVQCNQSNRGTAHTWYSRQTIQI